MKSVSLAIPLLGMFLAASAVADPYPHEPGRSWRYSTASGNHQVVTAGSSATIPLNGYSVVAQAFVFGPGGPHAGSTEWLQFEADNSVRLVQVTDATGAGYRYDPPLLLFPSPQFLFDVVYVFTRYQPLPSGTPGSFIVSIQRTDAPITVPAGTFTGISGTLRGLSNFPGDISDYVPDVWANGVGCVQYHDGEDYQLESVEAPTAALPASWGAIKRLYR